jgi:hypothetical protein
MTAVDSFLCGFRKFHNRCIISGRDVIFIFFKNVISLINIRKFYICTTKKAKFIVNQPRFCPTIDHVVYFLKNAQTLSLAGFFKFFSSQL